MYSFENYGVSLESLTLKNLPMLTFRLKLETLAWAQSLESYINCFLISNTHKFQKITRKKFEQVLQVREKESNVSLQFRLNLS